MSKLFYVLTFADVEKTDPCRSGRAFAEAICPLVLSSEPEDNLGVAELVLDRAVDSGLSHGDVPNFVDWLLWRMRPMLDSKDWAEATKTEDRTWIAVREAFGRDGDDVGVWEVAQAMAWLAEANGE